VDEKGHKLLIDEAKKSGVKQFIYTSTVDASPAHPIDFFRTKFIIEQYLANSGLNYSILRLAAFMEWHVYNLLAKTIVEKGKTTIFGKGTNPMNFIAVRDVVAALNKIVLNENYYNKIIPLTGPENISKNEVAELYGKALNSKPKVGHVPGGVLKVLSVLFSPFHPGLARVMKLSAYTENSDQKMDTRESIGKFGLQPTSINEFILASIDKK
jgi:NADH dehydrogenase